MGKPTRADLHRPGDPRHHPEHLYPRDQARRGRRALQHRIRDLRERQGPGQGGAVARGPVARMERSGMRGSHGGDPRISLRSIRATRCDRRPC